MMKRVTTAAIVLLLSCINPPVYAQAGTTAKAPLTQDQQTHAVQNFAVLASAMRSDKIGDDVKSALMGCIYSNSLQTISGAIDKLIAANPGKVDRAKPDDLLSAMVAVCGYKPSATSSANAAPASPAPTAPAGKATGR